jgi:hypothetical protein
MEERMLKIEFAAQVRQLNCSSGYFMRFYDYVGECNTHREAWEKLEEERSEYGLEEKYTSYDSFKKAKKTYLDIKFV